QTMSRFLPAVITAKTLRDLGLKPETAMHKMFGGIEQETASATHPNGRRDLKELDEITKKSIARLYDFQHADGGWGWWKEGESDAYMTADVVWGFSIARDAGMKVGAQRMENAFRWLNEHLEEEKNDWNLQAWMLHAMAQWNSAQQSKTGASVFDDVWE